MKGKILNANYQRALVIYESEEGDIGVLEMLDSDDLEIEDTIYGDLNIIGRTKITKNNKQYIVCIEDYGMSLQQALAFVY